MNNNFKNNDKYFDILDIYISSPEDFNLSLESSTLKIVTNNETSLKKKYKLDIYPVYSKEGNELNKKLSYYGETSRIDYIYINLTLKTYEGFVNYEYSYQLLLKIPDINQTFLKYDSILSFHQRPGKISLYRKFYYEHFWPYLDKKIEYISFLSRI